MIVMLPKLDVGEARFLEQLRPLRPRTFHPSVEGHHDQVEPRLYLSSAYIWQDQLVNQKFRISWRH